MVDWGRNYGSFSISWLLRIFQVVTIWKTAIISAPFNQFWWFLCLRSCFHMCRCIKWWLEVFWHWLQEWKWQKIRKKTLGENFSISLDMKIGHNFCPNWPNFVIFVAKRVKIYVLIRFMMTRTSYSLIWMGKIGFRGYYYMVSIHCKRSLWLYCANTVF